MNYNLHIIREISDRLMSCIHELYVEDHYIYVTSTMIDGIIKYDLNTGKSIQQFWPRNMKRIKRDLKLESINFNINNEDNRYFYKKYYIEKYSKEPSHLHLNAAFKWNDNLYALLNNHKAVINLSKDKVIFVDKKLRAPHNLIITNEGIAIINNSLEKKIMFYNILNGEKIDEINLLQYKEIKKIISKAIRQENSKDRIKKMIKLKLHRYLPQQINLLSAYCYVRGLDLVESKLFIGISPSSIICIDIKSKRLIDIFNYTLDFNNAIHGLKVIK